MAKILIIDDDVLQLKILEDILSEAGHEVVTLDRGVGATSLVAREQPDLVLLDVNMPFVGGEQLAKIFAEDPDLRDIKLALFTADSTGAAQTLVEQGYARDIVTKGPPPQMLAKVESLLG